MYFKWNPELAMQQEQVDEQHKSFISLMNELVCIVDDQESCDSLVDIFCRLKSHIELHFHEEEALMLQIGYSDRMHHYLEHLQFQLTLHQMQEKLHTCHSIAIDLFEYLVFWLEQHMLKEDLKLADYLRKQQQSNSKNEA